MNDDGKCYTCGDGCDKCNTTICTQCTIKNHTVYPAVGNTSCVSCADLCKTCSSEEVCLSCSDNYHLKEGECLRCDSLPFCVTCTQQGDCTSCKSEDSVVALDGGVCIPCDKKFGN